MSKFDQPGKVGFDEKDKYSCVMTAVRLLLAANARAQVSVLSGATVIDGLGAGPKRRHPYAVVPTISLGGKKFE